MDRDAIIKKVLRIEDKFLVARILDLSYISQKTNTIAHTDFLDPYQASVATRILSSAVIRDYCFYGGFDGAERVLMFFCPNAVPEDRDNTFSGFIKVLRIELKTRENYSHRDYLGSLMGIGIKREKIGDILVEDDFCLAVVMDEIAEYILFNLTKVGNAKASVQVVDISELGKFEPNIKEISKTVASLRLDSVASAGFNISRSKIAELISGEKVNLNWETINSLTRMVKEGDTISIRGKGRVVLHKIGNNTKKDRIHIILKKFV